MEKEYAEFTYDYEILQANSSQELVAKVRKALEKEWEPYGYPFYVQGVGFHQAMVQVDEEEVK